MNASSAVHPPANPTIYSHASYRSYLKACAESRIARNPSYSARAFAMQLGVTPAFFSEILSGKKHLSSDKAIEIGRTLSLDDDETRYFGLLVQVEKAKSEELRQSLLLQMREIAVPGTEFQVYDLERFQLIADWCHLAIRNLLRIDGFELSAETAARALGIPTAEAAAAIQRLVSQELIRLNAQTGRYERTEENLFVEAHDDAERLAIKRYHGEMMNRAIDAYQNGPLERRSATSLMIAADDEYLARFEKLSNQFLRDLNRLADESKAKKTKLFHISLFGMVVSKEQQESQ